MWKAGIEPMTSWSPLSTLLTKLHPSGFETQFSHLFISLDAIVECRGWTHDHMVSIGQPYQQLHPLVSLSLSLSMSHTHTHWVSIPHFIHVRIAKSIYINTWSYIVMKKEHCISSNWEYEVTYDWHLDSPCWGFTITNHSLLWLFSVVRDCNPSRYLVQHTHGYEIHGAWLWKWDQCLQV